MNGLFSATPAPGPIRLMVGSHGLLLVESVITWHLPSVPTSFHVLIATIGLLAAVAFIFTMIGEDPDADQPWWRHRHVR